jgi:hypothetical protein
VLYPREALNARSWSAFGIPSQMATCGKTVTINPFFAENLLHTRVSTESLSVNDLECERGVRLDGLQLEMRRRKGFSRLAEARCTVRPVAERISLRPTRGAGDGC